MKALSLKRNIGLKLAQLVGACFGLLNICCPGLGGSPFGRGGTTIISSAQGIYFLPRKKRCSAH